MKEIFADNLPLLEERRGRMSFTQIPPNSRYFLTDSFNPVVTRIKGEQPVTSPGEKHSF